MPRPYTSVVERTLFETALEAAIRRHLHAALLHDLAEQRRRFRLPVVDAAGDHAAVGDLHRLPAIVHLLLVGLGDDAAGLLGLGVELRALVDEQLHDLVDAAERGAVERRPA